MSVSINLLPDDLRRRSIRIRIIRSWTPVLLAVAVGIAGLTHYEWTQCSVVRAAADQLEPEVQIAEQSMLSVTEAEKRTLALKTEIAEMNALKRSDDPLKLLNIISRSATDIGDQLAVSRLDLFGMQENPESSDAAIPTSATNSINTSNLKRLRTVVHVNGLAVSDISVARFMNSLRSSGGFHHVSLKSSQPATVSGPLQREFVVECIREEQP
ncbi:MAG: PilN domain-containing protein [Planctomycetaceae bacterium]